MVSLGQLAYEAYRDSARGVSLISGAKLPPWLELPAGIIDAWEAAAQAVRTQVMHDER